MREIEPRDVVAAVQRAVARRALPLETDVEEISIEGVPRRVTADGRVILSMPDVHGRVREIEAKFPPPDVARPRPRAAELQAGPRVGRSTLVS